MLGNLGAVRAINIMRKVFDLKKITGLNIFNPCILVP